MKTIAINTIKAACKTTRNAPIASYVSSGPYTYSIRYSTVAGWYYVDGPCTNIEARSVAEVVREVRRAVKDAYRIADAR